MSNPLLGSLVDQFTSGTLNTTVWNQTSSSGVSIVTPGRVGIQAVATNTVLGASAYNITGQAIYARITPALAGTGGKSVATAMALQVDANNLAQMVVVPGSQFYAQVKNAGTTSTTNLPAYDPTQHAWWRLRETSGSIAFEASPDGFAWTTLATIAYTWSPTAVTASFVAVATDGTTGQTAYVEHVNALPSSGSMMPSWPQVSFQVAFNTGGTSSTVPYWTDLTSRLRGSWSAQQAGRQYELDQMQSGQLTVTLWNGDGALDPTNTSSPYSPNILPMRPCRLTATWPLATRNVLPQGLANGSSLNDAEMTSGSLTVATASPAPTGHATALAWTFGAVGALGAAIGQGTGSSFSTVDKDATQVTAGSTYTLSAFVSTAAGGDSGFQATPRISWYNSSGSRISSSDGTAVTVPVQPSWAQVSVTAAAPSGAVWGRAEMLNTNATTVTNTVYATAWQFEQASSVSPWTPPSVVYGLWQGYVERWPQQWDYSGTYGLIDLTCIDLLAGLAQFTLSPSVEAQLLSLAPSQFYPLDEPQGSTSFRDLTGKHASAKVAKSSYGAGTVTAGNSISGSGFVGGSGPVVTLSNPTPANTTVSAGSFVQLSGPLGPPSSGGWCRIICFRTTTVPTGSNLMVLWQANGTGSNQSEASLFINSSQQVNAQATNASGSYTISYVPSVSVCDGNWHMASMLLSADGKTLNINVDGVGYGSSSTSDVHPTQCTDDAIGMATTQRTNVYSWPFSGDIAYAAEFPTDQIPSLSDIAKGFSAGWAGESSAARAQRILNLAGVSASLTTNDATTAMGGAAFVGSDAMSALQVVAQSEAGTLYVDGSGVLHLDGRLWRYLQTSPSVTFGEQQQNGEIPYLGDMAIDYDPTHIYNDVSVTNQAPQNTTAQPAARAQNTSSQQSYFPRSLSRDINVQDQTAQQYQASYIASQYGQPMARVAALNVDGASNPALWSKILPIKFGTRAQVNRRPPTGPGAQQVTLQQFVEHITWTGDDQGNLRLSLQMTPSAPYNGWWVIASLHSTLQAQATAGTNTITLGALTGASLNPANTVLPNGTKLVVGYGTSIAETVTVQSVAATSPGYTSVVVTLTANLTSTHASGQTVCEPLPSGYQAPTAVASGFPGSLDAAATLSSTTPRIAY